MVLVSWHPCKLLTASNYVPRALQVLVRACARFARPRIFVSEEYHTVHTCARQEKEFVAGEAGKELFSLFLCLLLISQSISVRLVYKPTGFG